MGPPVGIRALFEADLREAEPSETSVRTTESEHLAQQGDRTINIARDLPLFRRLQQGLTPLLG